MRMSDWSSDVCSSDLVGQGTSFTIYLPVNRGQPGERRVITPPASKPQGNELWGVGTILLVEDEATVRAVAERALVRKGYRVVTAANGVEALERLAEEDHIDLLISRSEEHTSELQSLMRNSYAVFCLKKQKKNKRN